MKKQFSQILPWAFAIYAVSTLISMAVMSIGAGVLGFGLLFALGGRGFFSAFKSELSKPASRNYFWLALALALACELSLVVAHFAPVKYWGQVPEIRFLSDSAKLWYLFWPLAIAMGLRKVSESGRFHIVRAWILALGALSVMGIVQFFTGWPKAQVIPDLGYFHAILFLGHHLSVASILIFPYFVTLDFIRDPDAPKRLGLSRTLLLVIAFVSTVTLFLTFSRTLWIALPVGLIAWSVLSLSRKKAFAFLGLLLISAVLLFQVPSLHDRLFASRGKETRIALWQANLEFLKQRPLTGVGWRHNIEVSGFYLLEKTGESSVFSGHAHNNLIDFLGGTGALGAIAWLALCGWIFWKLFFITQRTRPFFRSGMISAWIVFQLNGLTQVNFWEGKVEHQLAWSIAWLLFWWGE